MLQKNLRKVKEEIKKKLPYLITLSYGLSIRYVYADGKSDPLASLKKLGTLVVSLVVVYGIVQAALGVAEAGRGMGNHDSSQMSSGLWRMRNLNECGGSCFSISWITVRNLKGVKADDCKYLAGYRYVGFCEIWISGMEYFYEKCLRTFDGIAITV